MAIIRSSPTDWTAQLTGEELVIYYVLHFKMEPEYAEEQVREHEGELFYVRLPLHVNTLQQLLLHLVLKDKELFELEEMTDEFVEELQKAIGVKDDDRNDISPTAH